jgi:hypothetical protein
MDDEVDTDADADDLADLFDCGRDVDRCISLVGARFLNEVTVSANAVYRVEHRVTKRAALLEEIEYLRLRLFGVEDTSPLH